MRITQLAWGIMQRTLCYGLTRGIVLGLIYGPLSVLTLVGLDLVGRAFAGTTGASQVNTDMLLIYVLTSLVGGSLFGATIGILSGIISGLLLIAILSIYRLRSISMIRHINVLCAVIAFADGMVTLWATVGLNLPRSLAYDRLIVGWILWVIIPSISAAVVGWLTTRQVAIRTAKDSTWTSVAGQNLQN